MSWTLAPSLHAILDQIDTRHPKRSKALDGQVGDQRHHGVVSDHNPNERGVVCAIDITHDPANGMDCGFLAEKLRKNGDRRIKYVIFRGRIFSSIVKPWIWRPYQGSSPHNEHMHISVLDDGEKWVL